MADFVHEDVNDDLSRCRAQEAIHEWELLGDIPVARGERRDEGFQGAPALSAELKECVDVINGDCSGVRQGATREPLDVARLS